MADGISGTSIYNTVFWATMAYFFLKFFLVGNSLPGKLNLIWPLGYLFGMMILLIFLNTSYMNSQCGFSNTNTIIVSTVIPWLVIFGLMVSVLAIAPGWKGPFSNTIGYMVVVMSGGKDSILNLLKKSPNQQREADADDKLNILGLVYDNPAPLFNQLNSTDFYVGLIKLRPYFKKDVLTFWNENIRVNVDDPDEALKNLLEKPNSPFKPLWKMVLLKETVSEWVWYLLTAGVVLATSTNIISNAGCIKSSSDESEYHSNLINNQNIISNQKTTQYYET